MNTTRLKFMFLEEPWNLELGTRPRCFPSSPGVPAFAPYPSHMEVEGDVFLTDSYAWDPILLLTSLSDSGDRRSKQSTEHSLGLLFTFSSCSCAHSSLRRARFLPRRIEEAQTLPQVSLQARLSDGRRYNCKRHVR
jgi:hypothetical protein